MTRRRKDASPLSEKESNTASERFKKMHIKVGLPITSISIGNIRKRERMERLHQQMSFRSDNRNWGNQSVVLSNSPDNRPEHCVASDSMQGEPGTSTAISCVKPLEMDDLVEQNLNPDSDKLLNSECVGSQHLSPQASMRTPSVDGQPGTLGSADNDDPQNFFSCPTDPQSASSLSTNIERKHNITNIVADIRMRAKHHHLRRRVVPHQDKSSSALQFQQMSPADLSHLQATCTENSPMGGTEEQESDKTSHLPFSTWREALRMWSIRNGGDHANSSEVFRSSSVIQDQGPSLETDHTLCAAQSGKELLPPPLTIRSPLAVSEFTQSPGVLADDCSDFPPASQNARGSISALARSVPLFGNRLFNNDSPMIGNRYGQSANEGEGERVERLLGSGRSTWSRRIDWKRRVQLVQRSRSWNNAEQQDREDCSPSARDSCDALESAHLNRLNEQVRSLRAALLRSEHELTQLKTQTAHYRHEMRSKIRRLSTAHACLQDAQELRFRSALDALNDNQKVLGYVESSFDHVLSIIGSGRSRCPGLRGHFLKALCYLGDNTIELVFQIIRISTKIYAYLRRMNNSGSNNNSTKIEDCHPVSLDKS